MQPPDITISEVQTPKDAKPVRELLTAYYQLRNYDAALGDYQREVQELPGPYLRPDGCLLLAMADGIPAGMVALRALDATSCEMKRLFVLPEFRKHQIGTRLVSEILRIATGLGYESMYLDTHPWMHRAEKLYTRFGFEPVAPYNDNPTSGIRHFVKALGGGGVD